jgi:BlaI family transcriptional regulator, penicillinase repressor
VSPLGAKQRGLMLWKMTLCRTQQPRVHDRDSSAGLVIVETIVGIAMGNRKFRVRNIPLTFLLLCSRFAREVVEPVIQPKLTKLELQILEALWVHGKASIREIQEAFPEPRPAYTTIQTTVYRLEGKKAVRRVRKIGNAHIFQPMVARDVARHRLLDEILSFFGGRAQPMMAQLAEAGKLTLDDVRDLEKTIEKLDLRRKAERKEKSK